MPFWSWFIVALLLAGLGWCGLRIRAQALRLERLRKALNEAKLRVHALETDQQRFDSHRENKEDRLRGYLKLMDELINTIPNPIYFKDAQGVFQGCHQVFSRS